MVEQCFSLLWPVKYKDKLDNVMISILSQVNNHTKGTKHYIMCEYLG